MSRAKASVDNPSEIKQTISQSRKKASKGTVVVQVFKNRLRLCWTHLGKRSFLYIGLPDSKVNRTVAEQKARQIELDIASGNFDESLRKYKPQVPKYTHATVDDLYERFIAHKTADVSDRTPENYRAAFKHLGTFFKDKPVIYIGNAADDFAEWLNKQGLAGVTVKTYLVLISAVWDWGIEHHITEVNPWKTAIKRLKIAPKQKVKLFTREEIDRIIEAFRTDRYYHHYADFVLFQFNTGCRTGEAIGLQWKHLSGDCSSVWIGETLTRNHVRKTTKTGKDRIFRLNSKVQQMLLNRRPENYDPDGLVFTTPKGSPIDDHNFRNRAWKTILTKLGIDYRKPYATRHSVATHGLSQMSAGEVAEMTGHSIRVLLKDYAGSIASNRTLPEL